MRVVAPEIFEIRIPRDLRPFILPQLNPDGIDDMGAVNTDIFRSASTFLMIFLVEGGGAALTLALVPLLISFFGQNYSLFGATLWNGGHYICTFKFSNG